MKAEHTLIDSSLADIIYSEGIERGLESMSDLQFQLDENIHGYDRIRLLIPIADFVHQRLQAKPQGVGK